MGSGFSKMKKQARLLEAQYAQMQEKMRNAEFVGSAGNGLVTVTLSGEKELKKIEIKPDCVDPKDVEGLQDLIKAAYQEAYQKAAAESEGGLGGMSGLFG
jgi:DNA-binding YbaB/EbfC family protein